MVPLAGLEPGLVSLTLHVIYGSLELIMAWVTRFERA